MKFQFTHPFRGLFLSIGLLSTVACKTTEPAPPTSETRVEVAQPAQAAPVPAEAKEAQAPTVAATAGVGEVAPAFTLPDLDGKEVSLSDLLGKVVVLEWFNPGCPFVKASHTEGSLVDAAKRLQEKGVVYLAINSGAPGKQGHGVDMNREGVRQFSLPHSVLLDETGEVGHLYGATNTPHLFVIDQKGTLVYSGAVDNSPDGEGKSPEGAKLVRYMEDAVTATLEGKDVAVPKTKAYGCSVKYGS